VVLSFYPETQTTIHAPQTILEINHLCKPHTTVVLNFTKTSRNDNLTLRKYRESSKRQQDTTAPSSMCEPFAF